MVDKPPFSKGYAEGSIIATAIALFPEGRLKIAASHLAFSLVLTSEQGLAQQKRVHHTLIYSGTVTFSAIEEQFLVNNLSQVCCFHVLAFDLIEKHTHTFEVPIKQCK